MAKPLFLFDICYTLLDVVPSHSMALKKAMTDCFDLKTRLAVIDLMGKTDRGIIEEVLLHYGVPQDRITKRMEDMLRIAAEHFVVDLKQEELKLMPGVSEILGMLSNNDLPLGLVTGNIEEIARAKLRGVRLNDFFPIGGFGDQSSARGELVKNAISFAKKHFDKEAFNDIFVVGDTPRDIMAAHSGGAKAIAVATGHFSASELLTYKPEFVLNDLSELPESVLS